MAPCQEVSLALLGVTWFCPYLYADSDFLMSFEKTCEFFNSMRLLPMLLLLFLFLSFFYFVWSLGIHYLKYRCGPQVRGRLHLLHILRGTKWTGAPAGFPESQGHTSSVSTPVAKPSDCTYS